MKLCDINPFIRYASMSDFSPISGFVRSYDSRLFYLIDGECKLTIEDREYKLKKDTLTLWRTGTKYRFDVSSKIKIVVLNFDHTQISNSKNNPIAPVSEKYFNPRLLTELPEFENCDCFNSPLVLENVPQYLKQLIKITEKFNESGIYKHEACSAMLKELLTDIAEFSSYSETKGLDKVGTVLEYLKSNFDKNIENQDLGKLAGYHSHYINRLVLKHTGITLRQHLIAIRIENARELLTKSELPVYEISERCGFNNTAYFSNHFKSRMGVSPREYRNRYQHLV